MTKKTAFVLAMVVTVLSCAGYSNATVLGTIEYNGAGGDLGGLGEFHEMDFSICYPLPLPAEPGPVNLGWDQSISLSWNVTPDDVGKTFFASADTHQSFDVFTFLLTNGIDNLLYLTDGTVSKFSTGAESTLINGILDCVDFEGYTIDSIALTVNNLLLDSNPIVEGMKYDLSPCTNYSYDITYTINGEAIATPEPATIFLLGFGGLALLRKRKG